MGELPMPRCLGIAVTTLALVCCCVATTAAPPSGLKGAGPDADKWVMDNADFVVALNVKQLVASKLLTGDGRDAVKALLEAEPKVAAALKTANVDVFEDVDSLLFSGSVGTKASDAKGVVIVKGRFDADKAFENAKKKADKVEILTADGVQMLKLEVQGHPAFAAFSGKTTLVVTQSKESTAAWAKNGGKTEAKMSPALKAALGSFKGTESMTFAMALTDDARAMIRRVPQLAVAAPKMQTITASLDVTDQVKLEVVAATSDARAAVQLKNAAGLLKGLGEVMFEADESFGPVIGAVLNEMKITTEGNSVVLRLTVDKAMLEKARGKKVSK